MPSLFPALSLVPPFAYAKTLPFTGTVPSLHCQEPKKVKAQTITHYWFHIPGTSTGFYSGAGGPRRSKLFS